MHKFLLAAWGLGIVTLLIGMAGFSDTRKIDRRFKNGYKNNQPDTRNFRTAAKRTLIGAVICLVAFGVGKLTPDIPEDGPAQVDAAALPAMLPPPAVEPKQEELAVSTPSEPSIVGPSSTKEALSVVQPEVEITPRVSNSRRQQVTGPITPEPCALDGTYFGSAGCSHDNVRQGYFSVFNDYHDAQLRIGGADVGFRIEQESWFNETKKICSTDECLLDRFNLRSADINSRYRNNG